MSHEQDAFAAGMPGAQVVHKSGETFAGRKEDRKFRISLITQFRCDDFGRAAAPEQGT